MRGLKQVLWQFLYFSSCTKITWFPDAVMRTSLSTWQSQKLEHPSTAARILQSPLHPPSKLLPRCLAITDLCVGVIPQPLFITYNLATLKENFSLCRVIEPLILWVASWLVRSTPDGAVRVRALARDIVLCSWARHLTLTAPLSIQVYK